MYWLNQKLILKQFGENNGENNGHERFAQNFRIYIWLILIRESWKNQNAGSGPSALLEKNPLSSVALFVYVRD